MNPNREETAFQAFLLVVIIACCVFLYYALGWAWDLYWLTRAFIG